jgi:hypothetical protein
VEIDSYMQQLSQACESPFTTLFLHVRSENITTIFWQELPRAKARSSHDSVVPTLYVPAFRSDLVSLDFRAPCPIDELLSWSITP